MLKLSRLFIASVIISLCGCSTSTSPPATPATAWTTASPTATSSTSGYPQHIALLLPLQGDLADAGQTIRDGFITAYHNAPQSEHPAQINIIDTSNNIQDAYQKAVQSGADFIVGPLSKTNLQSLIQSHSVTVNTLSLNYLDPNEAAPPQLYQFGLSPLDEARQAAALAWQKNHHNAIIIAPDSSWGKNLTQAFQDQWQALGGNVIDTLAFSSNSQTMNQQISKLLQFKASTDKQTLPEFRHDFDVIFLAASPANARQIRPLLKFYYAGKIPIYATSFVYAGKPQPMLDNDLDGIIFCDAPWSLDDYRASANLHQQIALFWPLDFQHNARLYALGVDAYTIVGQLNRLHTSPDQTLAGATGVLSLNSQQQIVRQLDCAQFQQGIPVLLNNNMNGHN